MGTHDLEGLVNTDAEGPGDRPLGLLDHDPAVQGELELLRQRLGPGERALLEDGDRREVGEGLDEPDLVRAHHVVRPTEDVHRADDVVPEAQREGVDLADAGGDGAGSEVRPALVGSGKILLDDRLTGAVALDAGALGVLELQELQGLGVLARRGDVVETA